MKQSSKIGSKSFKVLSLASAVGFITACGGTGQDAGTPSGISDVYSGVAIDGYLARSTVYLDTNNDGRRNPWEPFAFTDNDGYFSYNPLTDTDYCAAGATAEQVQYCLVANTRYSNVVLRIDNGYDIQTGEPFEGQLSRRLSDDTDEDRQNNVVSPITSLLTNIENATDQESVLTSLGLNTEDVNVNYLNTDGNGSVDVDILNSSIKVHKVVTVMSDRITDTYDEIGGEEGTPSDASASIYNNLANQIITTQQPFNDLIQNDTALAEVLDNTESEMREIYERKEFTLPADMGSSANPSQFSRVIDVSQNIVEITDSVVNVDNITNQDNAQGSLRAVETIVIKALEEQGVDNTIENATNFFSNQSNDELINALLENLGSDSGDVASLSNNDFTGSDFDSVEEITQVSSLDESAMPFTQIGGMRLKVSDLDLGVAPNDLDDSEVEWYFSGEADDLSGSFIACVKYIDGASSDGTLGDGNTRGERVEGFWSLLGATGENMESYSLLITLTFLETTYQAILKPNGVETINDQEYSVIRFDNDGEIRSWHSMDGIVLMGSSTIPSTDSECAESLPSRVGL